MAFLIDTNVLSELRKKEVDAQVRLWWDNTPANLIYISVLTLGEIRYGVERKRRKDPSQARILEKWLRQAALQFGDKILPITVEISERWGTLGIDEKLPDIDGLIAATALEHGLTLVTRNVKDFTRCGVDILNPWE